MAVKCKMIWVSPAAPRHTEDSRLSSQRGKKWIHFWGFQLSYPRHIEAVWVCVIFDDVFAACLSVICHGGFCRFVLAHVTIPGMLTTPAAICRASNGQIEASTRALSRVNRRRRENWKFPSHFMKNIHNISSPQWARNFFIKETRQIPKKESIIQKKRKNFHHTHFFLLTRTKYNRPMIPIIKERRNIFICSSLACINISSSASQVIWGLPCAADCWLLLQSPETICR